MHGNQTASVPEAYRRYLANVFRERFDLYATPVAIEFRTDVNPYGPRQSRAAADGGSRNNAGSTKTRLRATPKCRCGPVTRPVAPTVPMSCPVCTDSPGCTAMADKWQYIVISPSPWSISTVLPSEEVAPGIDDGTCCGGVHRCARAGSDVHATCAARAPRR